MLARSIYALIVAALTALASIAPSTAAEFACPSVLAPGSPISRQAWRYCVIFDLFRKQGLALFRIQKALKVIHDSTASPRLICERGNQRPVAKPARPDAADNRQIL
jgi:hypothetical protein